MYVYKGSFFLALPTFLKNNTDTDIDTAVDSSSSNQKERIRQHQQRILSLGWI
jgi:hypothetical protein